MRRAGLLLASALIVSACSVFTPSGEEGETPPAAETPAGDVEADKTVTPEWDAIDRVEETCGMDMLKPHLGRNILDVPPEIVPDTARILKPDSHVTMDYVPTRLNILTDEDGRVIGLKCG